MVTFLVIGTLESILFYSHTRDGFWLCLGAIYGMDHAWKARRARPTAG